MGTLTADSAYREACSGLGGHFGNDRDVAFPGYCANYSTNRIDPIAHDCSQFTGAGIGFKFWDATAAALVGTAIWAIAMWFERPEHIAQLRRQAMSQRFLWGDSARQYLLFYEHALRLKRSSAV